MRAGKVDHVEKESSAEPDENRKYAHFTHSAIFAEVKIDEELDVTRVTRVVSAVAAGRILNPKVAGARFSAPWSAASAWRCTRRPRPIIGSAGL